MDSQGLRRVALFANLSQDHLEQIATIVEEMTFESGQVIFREGDQGDRLYLIKDGRVRISKRIEGIGEEALAILDPGNYFGEMAILDDHEMRSADAIAHENCTLYAINKQNFEQMLFLHKELAYEILWSFVHTLSFRLRETNEKIKAFFAMSRF